MAGSLDGSVDAVGFAGEGDWIGGLVLSLDAVDLVVVGGVFEAGDLDGRDVLGISRVSIVYPKCKLCVCAKCVTLILKYVCSSVWNSNGTSPSFVITSAVLRLSRSRVTLYRRPNLYGHRLRAASSRFSDDRPKSSLTLLEDDSLVDLPRNSQRELRANPCWGSLEVASWSGAVPKTYREFERLAEDRNTPRIASRAHIDIGREQDKERNSSSQLHIREQHTGKTRGMPPRTAFVPSSFAPSLSHNFSSPEASFQLSTVAPYRRTSTLSPVGSDAVTRELPCEMVT